ncbi:MAG TPA: DUF2157 domain-containing protein [Anaeromyxobacteraceae bacterium]|nr:DUF2157 domain-containing protein [Anaeromyxobacteraceae bacterium]
MHDDEAQRRVDRIHAFQEELTALEREQVLVLDQPQRARLAAHHGELLRSLAAAFDVDVTGAQKQLSWGMRIVAFLGAAAMSAAVWFLFYKYWGRLGTPVQVAILVTAPLLALAGVELAARREQTGYFATIAALVAFACFVLDLGMLGRIFAITPSQHAFLAWGAFAALLAYGYGLRLLLVAAILSLMGWLTATVGTFGGCYWLSAGERPEHFILAGLAVFAAGFLPHPRREQRTFPATYRLFGLLAVLVAILVMANWGETSVLPLAPRTVEHLYQVGGFAASALAIWAGIRRRWLGTTNLGATFFAIFLYTKLYDWWWEWMARWLFFLVVGLVAVLLLLVMKRLRTAARVTAP